jgi:hypothetical protein
MQTAANSIKWCQTASNDANNMKRRQTTQTVPNGAKQHETAQTAQTAPNNVEQHKQRQTASNGVKRCQTTPNDANSTKRRQTHQRQKHRDVNFTKTASNGANSINGAKKRQTAQDALKAGRNHHSVDALEGGQNYDTDASVMNYGFDASVTDNSVDASMMKNGHRFHNNANDSTQTNAPQMDVYGPGPRKPLNGDSSPACQGPAHLGAPPVCGTRMRQHSDHESGNEIRSMDAGEHALEEFNYCD